MEKSNYNCSPNVHELESRYFTDFYKRGTTNAYVTELCCLFDLWSPAVSWEAPLGPSALRPPPVSAHAFVKFDRQRAVYFGGRRETGYTNDVYIFDLDRRVSGHRIDEPESSLE